MFGQLSLTNVALKSLMKRMMAEIVSKEIGPYESIKIKWDKQVLIY